MFAQIQIENYITKITKHWKKYAIKKNEKFKK